MTHEQITTRLATEVMGWFKMQGPFWWGENDSCPGYLHRDAPEQKPYVRFEPLTDHNDMALVRKKMRDDGWWRTTQDIINECEGVFDAGTGVTYAVDEATYGREWHKDELMAEALAILKAVEAEK